MDFYGHHQETSVSPAPFNYMPTPVSIFRDVKSVGVRSNVRIIKAAVTGSHRAANAAMEKRFLSLAESWKKATRFTSAVDDMAMNEHYQHIIGMGPSVVPLILRRLKAEPDFWFWALSAITGAQPVSKEQLGNLDQMTAAWLKWGRANGFNV